MARRPRSKPEPISREKLEKGLSRFMSRHTRDISLREGQEAYDFNIKVQKIDIPDIVRQLKSASEIDDVAETQMRARLTIFADALVETYPWVDDWYTTGRSGGWLTLVTDEPVLTDNWEIPRTDVPEGPKEWAPAHVLGVAARRLRELEDINLKIQDGISELIFDLESPSWWDVTPKDWMPPKKKPTMGGMFDFWKKKKEPESREIIRATPIEVVPPAGGIIPAGPKPGAFANPFEILAPPTPSPGGLVPAKPGTPSAFEMIAPREAPSLPVVRIEPPKRPVEPLMPGFDILRAPERPPARERRAPTGHPRDVIDWRMPTAEELAAQFASMPHMSELFRSLRAVRHHPEFKNKLRQASRTRKEFVDQPLVLIGPEPEDLAKNLDIPPEVVDVYRDRRTGEFRPEIWDELFAPMFESVTQAMELIKPEDLPGWFAIHYDPNDDLWWFSYLETP